jgi:periplasmic copper chaperone A
VPYSRSGPCVAAVAVAAALPAAASAHVTLQPSTAPADGFTRLDVRVPNERDDAGTAKVDVQMPPGFAFVSYEPRPGWKTRVYKENLDQPVDLGGFSVDGQFTRVVWQAKKPKRDRIAPGQFQDFPLSVRVPDGALGTQLVFRAFQTYQRGERVAWTGAPDADEPAPRVTLLAPEEE